MRSFSIVLFVLAAACGSDNNNACPSGDCDPFATFQDCFDDHHHEENFTAQDAIEVCCIDHPIGSDAMNVVCGDTVQSCEDYVTPNVTDPDVDTDVIDAACTKYVADRNG